MELCLLCSLFPPVYSDPVILPSLLLFQEQDTPSLRSGIFSGSPHCVKSSPLSSLAPGFIQFQVYIPPFMGRLSQNLLILNLASINYVLFILNVACLYILVDLTPPLDCELLEDRNWLWPLCIFPAQGPVPGWYTRSAVNVY